MRKDEKRFWRAAMLASTIFGGVFAADHAIFGHSGFLYNQGVLKGNRADGNGSGPLANFAGSTTHIAYDVKSKGINFGIGVYAGVPIFGAKVKLPKPGEQENSNQNIEERQHKILYGKQYADLSDLYVKYQSATLDLVVGRFSTSFLETDWLNTYVQGGAVRMSDRKIKIWAVYANDYTTFNYSPNLIASELAGWREFKSTRHFGKQNQILSGGINLDFDKKIVTKMFINYFLNTPENQENKEKIGDIFQAGATGVMTFGNPKQNQSITTARILFQSKFHEKAARTTLIWADQEFMVRGFLKFGAGILSTSGDGEIVAANDFSRFYAHKFVTPTSYNAASTFYTAGETVKYAFGGVTSDIVDLNIIIAGSGKHSEISIVSSFTVLSRKPKLSVNGFALKIGGGFVKSGDKGNAFLFTTATF